MFPALFLVFFVGTGCGSLENFSDSHNFDTRFSCEKTIHGAMGKVSNIGLFFTNTAFAVYEIFNFLFSHVWPFAFAVLFYYHRRIFHWASGKIKGFFGRLSRSTFKGNEAYKRRLVVLDRKINKNPNSAEVLVEKGAICAAFSIGDPEESVKCLKKALEIEPENIDAMFWLAQEYFNRFDDKKSAKELFVKAIDVCPDHAECHFALARILKDEKAKKELIDKHFLKAIELKPMWVFPKVVFARHLLEENDLDIAEVQVMRSLVILVGNVQKSSTNMIQRCHDNLFAEYEIAECLGKNNTLAGKLLSEIFQRKVNLAKNWRDNVATS
ncbi:tetratricopeptide repeat protein [Candidatus Dependentiae bacterium]